MKTFFKRDISYFKLDDETQTYTQVNLGKFENSIAEGINEKVYENLMIASLNSEDSSEEEFDDIRSQVISKIIAS
jgi:hypothetical protein